MHHKLVRFHAHAIKWRYILSDEFLSLVLALFVFMVPVGASTRFETRGLFMQSSVPHATTTWKLSLQYMSPEAVGSLDMLFCIDPLPEDPCVSPPGLDISQIQLTSQTGETGFSIVPKSPNHIVLSRAPRMIGPGNSVYTFSNVVNPNDPGQSFSIRLKSLASSDGTGPQIDFGTVMGQVTDGLTLQTQVPPMLIFCLAQQVDDNCASTNDTYYSDMGNLSPTETLTAQSQMAVGTNASGGFAITADGTPLAAGTNVIEGLKTPTPSEKGVNQFGINLVANNEPYVGSNPEGDWSNAVPAPDYSQTDKYKYVPGDVVAYSPNVSLMEKFTISYIVNSSPSLRPGVYSTTVTFIASGRF